MDTVQLELEFQHRHIGFVIDNLAHIAETVIAEHHVSGAEIGQDDGLAGLGRVDHGRVEHRVLGQLVAESGLALVLDMMMPDLQIVAGAHTRYSSKKASVRRSARLAAVSFRRSPNSAAKPWSSPS